MIESLLILLVLLVIVSLALLIWLLLRKPKDSAADLKERLSALEGGQQRVEQAVRDEIAKNRDELGAAAKASRQELSASMGALADSNAKRIVEIGDGQKNQLDSFARQLTGLTDATERRLESMRTTIEAKLSALQEDNSKKLDQMRTVVDEKLQNTLNLRLGQSFNIVVDRLEKVHKGLGEMQSLASGVGDLKRILKSRVRSETAGARRHRQ